MCCRSQPFLTSFLFVYTQQVSFRASRWTTFASTRCLLSHNLSDWHWCSQLGRTWSGLDGQAHLHWSGPGDRFHIVVNSSNGRSYRLLFDRVCRWRLGCNCVRMFNVRKLWWVRRTVWDFVTVLSLLSSSAKSGAPNKIFWATFVGDWCQWIWSSSDDYRVYVRGEKKVFSLEFCGNHSKPHLTFQNFHIEWFFWPIMWSTGVIWCTFHLTV